MPEQTLADQVRRARTAAAEELRVRRRGNGILNLADDFEQCVGAMLIVRVAKHTSLKGGMIRNCETRELMFAPIRNGGNYRLYDLSRLGRLSLTERSVIWASHRIRSGRSFVSLADPGDCASKADVIAATCTAAIRHELFDLTILRPDDGNGARLTPPVSSPNARASARCSSEKEDCSGAPLEAQLHRRRQRTERVLTNPRNG